MDDDEDFARLTLRLQQSHAVDAEILRHYEDLGRRALRADFLRSCIRIGFLASAGKLDPGVLPSGRGSRSRSKPAARPTVPRVVKAHQEQEIVAATPARPVVADQPERITPRAEPVRGDARSVFASLLGSGGSS